MDINNFLSLVWEVSYQYDMWPHVRGFELWGSIFIFIARGPLFAFILKADLPQFQCYSGSPVTSSSSSPAVLRGSVENLPVRDASLPEPLTWRLEMSCQIIFILTFVRVFILISTFFYSNLLLVTSILTVIWCFVCLGVCVVTFMFITSSCLIMCYSLFLLFVLFHLCSRHLSVWDLFKSLCISHMFCLCLFCWEHTNDMKNKITG